MIKIRIGNKLISNMSKYYAEVSKVWSDGVAVNMLDIYTKILLNLRKALKNEMLIALRSQ